MHTYHKKIAGKQQVIYHATLSVDIEIGTRKRTNPVEVQPRHDKKETQVCREKSFIDWHYRFQLYWEEIQLIQPQKLQLFFKAVPYAKS